MELLEKIKVEYRESINQEDTFTSEHVRYNVMITYNKKYYECSYQCNPKYQKIENMKKDIIYSVLTDANCYEYTQDIDDFQREFCYEKASELLKAYNGCKETYQALHKMFTNDELEELNAIFENY